MNYRTMTITDAEAIQSWPDGEKFKAFMKNCEEEERIATETITTLPDLTDVEFVNLLENARTKHPQWRYLTQWI